MLTVFNTFHVEDAPKYMHMKVTGLECTYVKLNVSGNRLGAACIFLSHTLADGNDTSSDYNAMVIANICGITQGCDQLYWNICCTSKTMAQLDGGHLLS